MTLKQLTLGILSIIWAVLTFVSVLYFLRPESFENLKGISTFCIFINSVAIIVILIIYVINVIDNTDWNKKIF